MSRKALILLGMIIGSFIGGYIPALFGADFLSMWAIVGNAAGGIAGIWISFKLSA
jgi:hypothetical protein